VFHRPSNYGAILYRFRDIASYCLKSRNVYTRFVFSASARGDLVGISRRCLIFIKLQWLWRNYDDILSRLNTIPERDGQTDRQNSISISRVSTLTRDKNLKYKAQQAYSSQNYNTFVFSWSKSDHFKWQTDKQTDAQTHAWPSSKQYASVDSNRRQIINEFISHSSATFRRFTHVDLRAE